MSTNKEIERKFLVTNDSWKSLIEKSVDIVQYYFSFSPILRVRVQGDQTFLTVKGSTAGLTRSEFEYQISKSDALDMITNIPNHKVSKVRHSFIDPITNHVWEIDEFDSDNRGLTLAEIELKSEDDAINLNYDWLGEEVSNDFRFYNSYLAKMPYQDWEKWNLTS